MLVDARRTAVPSVKLTLYFVQDVSFTLYADRCKLCDTCSSTVAARTVPPIGSRTLPHTTWNKNVELGREMEWGA